MQLTISPQIKAACPSVNLVLISGTVYNSVTTMEFWDEMEAEISAIKSLYRLENLNKRVAISATRNIYKALGKDPNRYRPSAEALCRRILRDIPIYKVSMLVDIINLVSIRSGFSIGAFDADKIKGNIQLGIGTAQEEFDAIGRGPLNIEGLPVYRDDLGAIGTPTSDHERTKLTAETHQLCIIINGYHGEEGLHEAASHAIQLLQRYAGLKNAELKYIGK